MKIAFCSDHRGYKLKVDLIKRVKEKFGYDCIDCGCYNEEMTHFPIYAFKTSELVARNEVDYGIVICGSGDGVCVASNKVKGIRCIFASQFLQIDHYLLRLDSANLHKNTSQLNSK